MGKGIRQVFSPYLANEESGVMLENGCKNVGNSTKDCKLLYLITSEKGGMKTRLHSGKVALEFQRRFRNLKKLLSLSLNLLKISLLASVFVT